ncbi:large ribosomal subunit protein mL63-like [Watersipora subatra]|uniref:large ribosomal subunit protein mL63-like n=1 Tax=Watersipora subatra TaxID=2589382 RepID=UPI00355B6819
MRLTAQLLYYVHRRHIPGKINIGKYRVWPRITKEKKFVAAHDLVRENENMALLSRPYLTEMEDQIRLEEIEEKWKQQETEKYKKRIAAKMPQHFTTLDALEHLNSRKSWM